MQAYALIVSFADDGGEYSSSEINNALSVLIESGEIYSMPGRYQRVAYALHAHQTQHSLWDE